MRVFILNSVWNRTTMKRPQCRNCTWEKSTNPSFVQSHLPHVRIQFEPSRIFTRTKFFGCFTRSWYSTLFLIGRCKLSRALNLFHLCLCSLLPVSESWRKLWPNCNLSPPFPFQSTPVLVCGFKKHHHLFTFLRIDSPSCIGPGRPAIVWESLQRKKRD